MTGYSGPNPLLADIRGLAHSLRSPADLDPILRLSVDAGSWRSERPRMVRTSITTGALG